MNHTFIMWYPKYTHDFSKSSRPYSPLDWTTPMTHMKRILQWCHSFSRRIPSLSSRGETSTMPPKCPITPNWHLIFHSKYRERRMTTIRFISQVRCKLKFLTFVRCFLRCIIYKQSHLHQIRHEKSHLGWELSYNNKQWNREKVLLFFWLVYSWFTYWCRHSSDVQRMACSFFHSLIF